MKKILSVILLISMFGINFVNANIEEANFNSVHNINNSHTYKKHFRDISNFTYSMGENDWQYSMGIRKTIRPNSNFRIFIPNYTKWMSISMSREGSGGWMTFAISLGNIPSIYNQNYTLKKEYIGEYDLVENPPELILANSYSKYGNDSFGNIGTYSKYLLNGKTLLNKHSSYYDGALVFSKNERKKLNKWLYFANDRRNSSDNGHYENFVNGTFPFMVSYTFDAKEIDSLVEKLKQKDIESYNKFHEDCSKINYIRNNEGSVWDNSRAKNLCIYVRSFGEDGSFNDISSHKKTVEAYNKIWGNITGENEEIPTNPSMGVEIPNGEKKTSTIELTKNLNLISFLGDTRLKDLSGCKFGVYDKGQYKGKKAIFGVKGSNFIITPNNAETSVFKGEMGVFIYVKEACTLKYSYSEQ